MGAYLRGEAAYRAAVAAAFAALLAVGLCVYRDYGLSWDEEISRLDCGLVNYEYVRGGEPWPLLLSAEKYHGPAFEVFLIALEKGLGPTDSRAVYLMRHLVTFLTFYAAVIAFFLLLRGRFGRATAACGTLFLVLSPRIFAESFYNSKDLVFLSLYVVSLYTLVRFRRAMTPATTAAHALACALLTDVRLPGVVVPCVTVGLAAADGALARYRVVPGRVVLFAALYAGGVVLFWPVLWSGPLGHFRLAFREMSRYPWLFTNLYLGEELRPTELPWHYVPVWVAVTTPVLYSACFVLGLGRLAFDAARSPLAFWEREDVPVLLCLFGPLGAVIGLHAAVYDGWRHVYFLYPPFLYVATAGLETAAALARAAGRRLPGARPLFAAGVAAALVGTAVTMVRDHPFQNVYFNRLAGPDLDVIRHRFDADYWGLSYRRGLEYVLAHDPAPAVVVRVDHMPGELNRQILPPEDRRRLRYTAKPGEEDYFLTTFRWRHDYAAPREVFAVRAGGGKILVVEKVK